MLVHDFAYIDVPAGVVRARLVGAPNAWLESMANHAAEQGDALRVRLGPHGTHGALTKSVVVEVGHPVARAGATLIPLTWRATGVSALFPMFSGDIEVAAIGGAETVVSIWGQYEPPLGALGDALDRFGLHRIAESSVRSFLQELAQSFTVSEDIWAAS
ncbi:MAG: hypothetical protein JOZ75_01730 [Candidatus Dormibacteraeota bacterium]|nr:hypothetical protein [Candidatus Dormibacteraeota bacterium]